MFNMKNKIMVREVFEVPKQKKKRNVSMMHCYCWFLLSMCCFRKYPYFPIIPSPHGRFTSLLVWTFHLRFLLSFFAFKTLFLVIFSMTVLGVGIRLFLETSNFTPCYEDWATSCGEGEGRQWREVCFWSLQTPTLFKTKSVHFVTLLRSRDLFGGSKYDTLLENISFFYLNLESMTFSSYKKGHIKYVDPKRLILLFFFCF